MPGRTGNDQEAIRTNEIWIAERDQDLAGFYELIPDTLRRHGEVRMCFVDPAFLRQGVASVLWRHLELRAHVRGVSRLGLDADPNAVPFYSAVGLKIVGESPSATIPGRFLPRMEKPL